MRFALIHCFPNSTQVISLFFPWEHGVTGHPPWRSGPRTGLIPGNALVRLLACSGLFIAPLFCEIAAFEVMLPTLIE